VECIRKSATVEFRAELFNAFSHPQSDGFNPEFNSPGSFRSRAARSTRGWFSSHSSMCLKWIREAFLRRSQRCSEVTDRLTITVVFAPVSSNPCARYLFGLISHQNPATWRRYIPIARLVANSLIV